MGTMLADVAGILREHGLVLPADLALMIKAFLTLEGMGRQLDPDFDMAGAARPFLERAMLQARELGMSRLEVEASAFSLGLFLKLGFTLIGVERVERGGVAFERHRLERLL